jgi:hypothetical protein
VNHGVHRSSVPDADSRPQFHSSPEGTVPCTARTAFRRESPARAAAPGKPLAGAVRTSCLQRGWSRHLRFQGGGGFPSPSCDIRPFFTRSRGHSMKA